MAIDVDYGEKVINFIYKLKILFNIIYINKLIFTKDAFIDISLFI